MMAFWLTGSCVALLCLVAEKAADPALPPEEQALAQAQAAASAFTQELLSTLMAHLRAEGPVGAVSVCAEKAPQLAQEHSREGVRVRRVSLRVRNPANRPDAYEKQQLERWAEQLQRGEEVREVWTVVQEKDQRVLRYLRPIRLGELCVRCHGPRENLDPALRQVLAQKYPEDEAVGYQAGDLRGAVSVTVLLPAKVSQ
jgi:hypothetical protein